MKRLFTYLLLTSLTYTVTADEWEDVRRSFATMYGLHSFSFKVEVKMYKNKEDVKPELEFEGEAKKKGANYFSNLTGRSVVYNEDSREMLHINHNDKTIIYTKTSARNKSDSARFTAKEILQLDSVMLANSTAKYIGKTASAITIEFVPNKKGAYKRVLMVLDAKTWLLKKMQYFPAETEGITYYHHIDIDYSSVATGTPSEEIFNTRKYITVKGKEIVPAATMKGYKVIDQMKQPNSKTP